MKTYTVKRGPVWPPASLYGKRAVLSTGDTLRSESNSWIRRCLADGRLSEVEPAPVKKRGKGGSDG